MVDTAVLEAAAARCESSSLSSGTNLYTAMNFKECFEIFYCL